MNYSEQMCLDYKINNNLSNEFMLFCVPRYQGYISAALVLGGVDLNGPTLHTVYPHGSTDKLPYVTMGKVIFDGISALLMFVHVMKYSSVVY